MMAKIHQKTDAASGGPQTILHLRPVLVGDTRHRLDSEDNRGR
jgi:hypothetical protein